MKIREIKVKDLTVISNLYVSVFGNPPWNEYWEYAWAYKRLLWIFNSQGFKGYIAEVNSKIIGAILGFVVPFKGKKGFNIIEFFIALEHQKQGIGSKLLKKLEIDLKNYNHDFITLLTAKNSSAEVFYLNRQYNIDREIELLNKEI